MRDSSRYSRILALALLVLCWLPGRAQKGGLLPPNETLVYSRPISFLDSLSGTGSAASVDAFPADACAEGRYHVGLRLLFDLGERKADTAWHATLRFLAPDVSRDTLELHISDSSRTVLSSWVYDVAPEGISCFDPQQVSFRLISWETSGSLPDDAVSFDLVYYRTDRIPLSHEGQFLFGKRESSGRVMLYWDHLPGAQEYDLEWTFIDLYEEDMYREFLAGYEGDSSEAPFAFMEPARISTPHQYFETELTWPRGTLYYRVRGAAQHPDNGSFRMQGAWNYGSDEPLHTVLGEGLEKGLHWQSASTFAEDGKHKKVVGYYDPTLRNRQTVTNLSTDRLSLVAESFYDYEGRPVASVLPVPSKDRGLGYKDRFNVFASNADLGASGLSDVSRQHFDNDSLANSVLSKESGAAQYYSDGNNVGGTHRDYIPDADGYVYTQVQYLDDNTGRVRKQSGLGASFALDGPHTTQYFYGNPTYEEMVRLFGTNLGAVSHYKKTMVLDPNGQVSIAYMDQGGRTVATSLAGEAPPNMDGLDRTIEPLSVDLMKDNRRNDADGTSTVRHGIQNAKRNTRYDFTYALSGLPAQFAIGGQEVCLDCRFELEVGIMDSKGRYLALGDLDYAGSDPDAYPIYRKEVGALDCMGDMDTLRFSVVLREVGSYTLVKRLRLLERNYERLEARVDSLISLSYDSLLAANPVDSADCELCVACDSLPIGLDLDGFLNGSIAGTDCERILNEIEERLRAALERDPTVAEMQADSRYCEYEYCMQHLENGRYTVGMNRIRNWEEAVAAGYANPLGMAEAGGLFQLPDPFFLLDSLAGDGYGGQMADSLRDVTIGGVSGDLWKVLEDDGLYEGIDTDSARSERRWALFRSIYTEKKLNLMERILEDDYGSCPSILETLRESRLQAEVDALAEGEGSGLEDGNGNPVGIGDIDDVSGIGPAGMFDIDTAMVNIALGKVAEGCPDVLDDADSTAIFGALWGYYDSRRGPSRLTGVIDIADVGIHPGLVFIDSLLAVRGCDSLSSVAYPDPMACLDSSLRLIPVYDIDMGLSFNGGGGISVNGTPNWMGIGGFLSRIQEKRFRMELILTARPPGNMPLLSFRDEQGNGYALGIGTAGTDGTRFYFQSGPDEITFAEANTVDLLDGQCHTVEAEIRKDGLLFFFIDGQPQDVQNFAALHSPEGKREFRIGYDPFARGLGANDRPVKGFFGKIRKFQADDLRRSRSLIFDLQEGTGTEVAGLRNGRAAKGVFEGFGVDWDGQFCYAPDLAPKQLRPTFDGNAHEAVLNAPDLKGRLFERRAGETDISVTMTIRPEQLAGISEGRKYTLLDWRKDNCCGVSFGILPDGRAFFEGAGMRLEAEYACESIFDGGCHTAGFRLQGDEESGLYTVALLLDGEEFFFPEPLELELPGGDIPLYLGGTASGGHHYAGQLNGLEWKAVLVDGTEETRALYAFNERGGSLLADGSGNGLDFGGFDGNWQEDACGDPVPNPYKSYDSLWVCREYNTIAYDTLVGGLGIDADSARKNCLEELADERDAQIVELIGRIADAYKVRYARDYAPACFDRLEESFRYEYIPAEYHFTLYYYDQAGSLVQTVPPAGVDILPSGTVRIFSEGNGGESLNPDHRMETRYRYNSLGQLVWQSTPDGGISEFWYDNAQRLRISRDAQQAEDGFYSYTRYDAQGRIMEVGELQGMADGSGLPALPEMLAKLDGIGFPASSEYLLEDRTITHYDNLEELPYMDVLAGSGIDFTEGFLRGRVVWTEVRDNDPNRPRTAEYPEGIPTFTVYNYDVHGNVCDLLQFAGQAKTVSYAYDLVSGNVRHVVFQRGASDQFMHRYAYDADNRLTEVETSQDGYVWQTEAVYRYYAHGPLARVELGEYKVQGLDYYYTLQGWLKGVNTPGGSAEEDLGKDGHPADGNMNRYVASDALGYALGYYQGDYAGIGATAGAGASDGNFDRFRDVTGSWYDGSAGLFNGNIAWMATDLKDSAGTQAMAYRYDQLNRIRRAVSFQYGADGTWQDGNGKFNASYRYDGNGNILSLQRNNGKGETMDELSYSYKAHNNQLRKVEDAASVAGGYELPTDLNSDPDVYIYDKIGNLVADKSEGIVGIDWTVYGKVRSVMRVKEDTTYLVSYLYDAGGNRIRKTVKKIADGDTTGLKSVIHYRDAGGNIMLTHTTRLDTAKSEVEFKREFPIYGSSRLGMYRESYELGGRLRKGTRHGDRTLGNRLYELSNHLGNVLVVVTDDKLADSIGADGLIAGYRAQVVSRNDYYPFGLSMKERAMENEEYRFGFQGQEEDKDIKEGSYTAEFWQYDSEIARRWNVDPIIKKHESPYVAFANNPIWFIDPNGADTIIFSRNFKRRAIEGKSWGWEPVADQIIPSEGEHVYLWEHANGNISRGNNKYVQLWSKWSLRGHEYWIEGTDGVLVNNFVEELYKYLEEKGVRNYTEGELRDAAVEGRMPQEGRGQAGVLDLAYNKTLLTNLTYANGGRTGNGGVSNSLFLIDGKYANANEAGNFAIGFGIEYAGGIGDLNAMAQIYTLLSSGSLDEEHEQRLLSFGRGYGRMDYNLWQWNRIKYKHISIDAYQHIQSGIQTQALNLHEFLDFSRPWIDEGLMEFPIEKPFQIELNK